MHRVLLLIPSTSYRARDFLEAARRLGVEVVVGSNHHQVLAGHSRGGSLALDFEPTGEAVSRILDYVHRDPLDAIVGTDDETVLLAATASTLLGLPHNDPESVATARDKHRFRQVLTRAGMRSPRYQLVSLGDRLETAARSVPYPCVLKPLALSASRGVIRADDEAGFLSAAKRISGILEQADGVAGVRHGRRILVEGFISGREVALEGLLSNGRLQPLALFDKPDPLDGPYFEETLYMTPSQLTPGEQHGILAEVARAAAALGLSPLVLRSCAEIQRISITHSKATARQRTRAWPE